MCWDDCCGHSMSPGIPEDRIHCVRVVFRQHSWVECDDDLKVASTGWNASTLWCHSGNGGAYPVIEHLGGKRWWGESRFMNRPYPPSCEGQQHIECQTKFKHRPRDRLNCQKTIAIKCRKRCFCVKHQYTQRLLPLEDWWKPHLWCEARNTFIFSKLWAVGQVHLWINLSRPLSAVSLISYVWYLPGTPFFNALLKSVIDEAMQTSVWVVMVTVVIGMWCL